MNLILVDEDAAGLFSEEILKERLHDCGVKIKFLDIRHLPDSRYRLENLPGQETGGGYEKCIFLTKFGSGMLDYHVRLAEENQSFGKWFFVILDMPYQSYRAQFSAQIDEYLMDRDFFYKVLFDHSDTLEETRKLCRTKTGSGKICVIASKEDCGLTEKVRMAVESLFPDWELIVSKESCPEAWDFADRILIVGRRAEDFCLPPVDSGKGRVKIWIDDPMIGCTKQEIEEKKEEIRQQMNLTGWDLAEIDSCSFYGDLDYEVKYSRLLKKELSVPALVTDESFVMWDHYGIPLRRADYTEEKICTFLKKVCGMRRLLEQNKGEREGQGREDYEISGL